MTIVLHHSVVLAGHHISPSNSQRPLHSREATIAAVHLRTTSSPRAGRPCLYMERSRTLSNLWTAVADENGAKMFGAFESHALCQQSRAPWSRRPSTVKSRLTARKPYRNRKEETVTFLAKDDFGNGPYSSPGAINDAVLSSSDAPIVIAQQLACEADDWNEKAISEEVVAVTSEKQRVIDVHLADGSRPTSSSSLVSTSSSVSLRPALLTYTEADIDDNPSQDGACQTMLSEPS